LETLTHPGDNQRDNLWAIHGTIGSAHPDEAEGQIMRVGRIGS